MGLYDEPYAIYLEKGTHTISIERTAEAAMIQEITLADWKKNIPSYSDYLASFEKTDATNVVVIEAEDAVLKSDRTLAATADMTNAGMSPVSADRRLINSFGKDYWTTNGQWAMWRVPDDAQEGFYTLAFRAKQSGAVGTTTFGVCMLTDLSRLARLDVWHSPTRPSGRTFSLEKKAPLSSTSNPAIRSR